MRKRIVSAILLFLLLFAISSVALAETGRLFNGDFSLAAEDSGDLPKGWVFEEWEEGVSYAKRVQSGEQWLLYLHSYVENDACVCQTVTVLPNTCYRLEGDLYVRDIQGESGANISVLDSFASSACITDAVDWKHVVLLGVTGAEQTSIRVALRIGQYGQLASGEAWFSNVMLTELDAIPANAQSFSPIEEETPHKWQISVWGWVALTVALFAIIWFCIYKKAFYRTPRKTEGTLAYLAPLILVLAFLIRMLCSLLFVGHPTDIICFQGWASTLAETGPGGFYTSGIFADYPPGYLYILWIIGAFCNLLHIQPFSSLAVFLLKVPSIAADLICGYFVYRFARKKGVSEKLSLILLAVTVCNPVSIFVSGAWGQIDSFLTLLLLIFLYLYLQEKVIAAGAVFGLSILVKPQALIFAPLFFIVYLIRMCRKGIKKQWWITLLSYMSAFAVLFLFSLPFQGTQESGWLLEKYFSTATSYQYASVEAFNLAALCGGNWRSTADTVFLFSYQTWGTLFIVLSVIASVILYLNGSKQNKNALLLASIFLLTAIFTLGQYMHERYLFPILLLLPFAYLAYGDRRLMLCYGWFSVSLLLNVLCAFYVVAQTDLRNETYQLLMMTGSCLQCIGFAYLTKVCFDLVFRNRRVEALPPRPDHPRRENENRGVNSRNFHLDDPMEKGDGKIHFTRKDRYFCFILTAVYAVITLCNLGSLSAPESFWQGGYDTPTVQITFKEPARVEEVWINGNIGYGSIRLEGQDGASCTIQQTYDDMFRWQEQTWSCQTQKITLTMLGGNVRLNEIAFLNEKGQVIPIRSVTEGNLALVDEQNTVPTEPSCGNGMYFDEIYHARTAYEHLQGWAPYENSHPPLGKILIMAGIALFGMNPFGWRIMGALFGIAMIPLLYCFAKRILRQSEYALLAAFLFAFDFMHFTQTRLATVDVFVVFFILAMYYYMYQYVTMDFFGQNWKKSLSPLWKSGLFFAFGIATKWNCIFAGVGLAVLLFAVFIRRYLVYREAMRSGETDLPPTLRQYPQVLGRTILLCVVFFLVVPLVVYTLSYTPYYLSELHYGLSDVIDQQSFILGYHSSLGESHPYASGFLEWPFTIRPMWYYYRFSLEGGMVSSIAASGNPAVWWLGTIGLIVLIVLRLLRKIRFDHGAYVPLVGLISCYVPWIFVSRCTFIYHFFPCVPFLILFSVFGLQKWEQHRPGVKMVKWAWMVVCLLLFVLLYPGLSGLPVPDWWVDILRLVPGGNLFCGA